MKTAFVHDRIAHEGGAEAVLRDLIAKDNHDEGVIFTYYSTQTRWRVGEQKYRVITALPRRLNNWFITCNTRKFFILSTLFDYRNLMFRFPYLTRKLSRKIKKYSPDKIIISSFAAVKNIAPIKSHQKENALTDNHTLGSNIHNGEFIRTTLYLHSPMQYIRENYYDNVSKLHFPIKQLYQLAAGFLRPRDKKKRDYDTVYFNSEYTQEIAEKLYGLSGSVKYPPIDKVFHASVYNEEIFSYYIFLGRIVKYVREIDKIIDLFNKTGHPLIVVGDGPDMGYAQSIAGANIMFTGRIDEPEAKRKLLERSRGLINLAKESFGIATAEALCSGVPVFGFDGGATKYLINDSNGYLVEDKGEKSLLEGFEEFSRRYYNRKKISEDAQDKFFD